MIRRYVILYKTQVRLLWLFMSGAAHRNGFPIKNWLLMGPVRQCQAYHRQRRISEIGTRLNHNAKVQEGEEPSEAPEALMEELDRSIKRLEELIAGINRTNSATVHEGRTLTDLLAARDCLKLVLFFFFTAMVSAVG